MNKKIIAIDPGNIESAIVIWDGKEILFKCKEKNDFILNEIYYRLHTGAINSYDFCVEKIQSYGMAVGQTTFDTAVWAGRFLQKFEDNSSPDATSKEIFRREVKLHHCGHVRARDSNIITALVDRFEPNGNHGKYGKGIKKDPGLFYEFNADIWQAFALAVYYYDTYIK